MLTNPIASTDNIWREEDTSRSLTSDLRTIEQGLSDLTITKANTSHPHTNLIQSINTSLSATASNGSFSVVPDVEFINLGTYLVNIQYSTSSGLVGRSTYSLRIDKSSTIQRTITLSECKNGNDNFMVTYQNNTYTFVTSYTGTGSPTNVTFNIL